MSARWLVFGIYLDDYQRFAEAYDVGTAKDAEWLAVDLHPGLVVCGVYDLQNNTVAA